MTTSPPVTFVYTDWIAMFPQFAQCVSPELGQLFFQRAANLFPNSASNPAYAYCGAGVPFMTSQLYLLTAHLAALSQRAASGAPVGRISSASEGSVSASFEVGESGSPSEAFYTQTQYGFEFWQANAPFRTMRYVPLRTFVPTAIYPSRRRWGY